LFTAVDEYLRHPFAFACLGLAIAAVINCLSHILPVFRLHNDRGAAISRRKTSKIYLGSKPIATSHSTPFNPTNSSQMDRFNGIVLKTVRIVLKACGILGNRWKSVLIDYLHAIMSSAATN